MTPRATTCLAPQTETQRPCLWFFCNFLGFFSSGGKGPKMRYPPLPLSSFLLRTRESHCRRVGENFWVRHQHCSLPNDILGKVGLVQWTQWYRMLHCTEILHCALCTVQYARCTVCIAQCVLCATLVQGVMQSPVHQIEWSQVQLCIVQYPATLCCISGNRATLNSSASPHSEAVNSLAAIISQCCTTVQRCATRWWLRKMWICAIL